MAWDLTAWEYAYGVFCAAGGWVLGLLTPRIWRFMNTTFGGA